MSEENTERFEGGTPFQIRVLRELANLNRRFDGMEARLTNLENRFASFEGWLTSLEEKVDARLRETRPIWENVLTRLETIDAKLDVFWRDLLETRADVEKIKKRLPAA